jgi:glutamate racemase
MSVRKSDPIGVFDSGVGGLSVLKEIHSLMPTEKLLYLADSGHVPYGNKSPEYIVDRSQKIASFLVSQGAKAIVVACNTATAAALYPLRKQWPEIPIIGMEPAVKPAMAVTKVGLVGVLATVGTLKSAKFAALLEKFGASTKVVTQPAPGLVECVERGDLESDEAKDLVASFVKPLLQKRVDVIVLGCTHYPFLKKLIAEIAGPDVTLIDTGAAVAKQVRRRLEETQLLNLDSTLYTEHFYTSGNIEEATKTFSLLWSHPVKAENFTG